MQLVSAPSLTELVGDLGPNWRINFYDADGFPLTMLSFQAIDFGAISYKEIFQNVKTILTTPLFSAALERTLGIDQSIVDLPMNRAAEATVAIIDALYFWEPRCEVMNIEFEPDVLNGKLAVNLSLRIRNIIYGTDTPYDKRTIYEAEPKVPPALPPSEKPPPPITDGGDAVVSGPPGPAGPTGPVGPTGATGPAGQRGSIWFTGIVDPMSIVGVQANDMYLNTTTAAIFQYDGTTWRRIFDGLDTKG
jgi:Bacteriophage baseplate protein W